MNIDSIQRQTKSTVSTGVIAGLAGGVAEMIWVAGYCAVTPLSAAEVLRQISLSVGLDAGHGALASVSGIAIHLGLSVALGLAFALLVWRPLARRSGIVRNALMPCAALALVWAVNFFLVLPALNPAFVALMPYSVTLASKLLFGVAMGSVLNRSERQDQRSTTLAFGRAQRSLARGL